MSDSLTTRLLAHHRIQARPPSPPKSSWLWFLGGRFRGEVAQALAVRNQLLVSPTALGVPAFADQLAAFGFEKFTSIFEGLDVDPVPGTEDVEIWRSDREQDVFAATDRLRALLAEDQQNLVSPNHVLIPAWSGDECPAGPPRPLSAAPPALPAAQAPPVQVAVVDAGYYWDYANWPMANPLDARNVRSVPAETPGTGGWPPTDPDVLGPVIGALIGHANFIAGVIAQEAPHAEITIWNFDGGFSDPALDPTANEAAVIRALHRVQSQQPRPSVINVGFAFAPYSQKGTPPVVHAGWDVIRNPIGDAVIVAPVGNQGSAVPRYPAALHSPQFPNVIGVGSHDSGSTKPSVWGPGPDAQGSNRGAWVTCSSVGTNVVSTFLDVDLPTEEDPTGGSKNFTNFGWARWNGTSFAAPKIVAAIVNEIAAGAASPLAAWLAIEAATLGGGARNPDLGVIFP